MIPAQQWIADEPRERDAAYRSSSVPHACATPGCANETRDKHCMSCYQRLRTWIYTLDEAKRVPMFVQSSGWEWKV